MEELSVLFHQNWSKRRGCSCFLVSVAHHVCSMGSVSLVPRQGSGYEANS